MEIGYEKFVTTSPPLLLRIVLATNCAYGAYWLSHILIFCADLNPSGSYLASFAGLLLGKYLADTGKFFEPSPKGHPLLKMAILAGVSILFVSVGCVVGFCCFGYFSSFQGDGQLEQDCARIGLTVGILFGLWLTSRL